MQREDGRGQPYHDTTLGRGPVEAREPGTGRWLKTPSGGTARKLCMRCVAVGVGASNPERGVMKRELKVLNQRGEVVQEALQAFLLKRKSAA